MLLAQESLLLMHLMKIIDEQKDKHYSDGLTI